MSPYETQILPTIVLFGLFTTIAWGAWCERQDRVAAIRKAAFEEAGEALDSLAKIARWAVRQHEWHGDANATLEAGRRGYYYERAAMIVRSIPAERA